MSNQHAKRLQNPSLAESNLHLRQQGYRLTPQRYLILSLLEKAQAHLNVEELLEQAQSHYPSMNLSTIYRTLDLLKELGLVRETRFPDENPRYEIQTQKTHHHLICRQCRAVTHLEDPSQEHLRTNLEHQHQYHQVQMEIMSVGYCNRCWQDIEEKMKQEEQENGPSRI